MIFTKRNYVVLTKRCTCGFLAGVILVASMAEILDCPIHGNKNCQTQHIEQTYNSSGTINNSGVFTP